MGFLSSINSYTIALIVVNLMFLGIFAAISSRNTSEFFDGFAPILLASSGIAFGFYSLIVYVFGI